MNTDSDNRIFPQTHSMCVSSVQKRGGEKEKVWAGPGIRSPEGITQ